MDALTTKHLNLCENTRCNYCRETCPVYKMSRLEFDSPRTKLELIMDIKRGLILDFDEATRIVYNCHACNSCMATCPYGINVPKIIWDTRNYFSRTHSFQKYVFYFLYNLHFRIKRWSFFREQ